MKHLFLGLAATVCLVSTAAAALKTGDEAPKIKVASWAQGDPVEDFEGDKVYIVEFWATWCGPCIASIPHIDALYKANKDKGLVVIGQNLGEDAATVSAFVKKMAGKMSYRVTVDDKTDGGWMGKNWLKAAGQNGIPCAFIVNKKGKIAFIGHPMEIKEATLASLLAEPSTKPAASGQPAAVAPPSPKAMELATRAQSQIRDSKFAEAEATVADLHEALAGNHGYIGGLIELNLLVARKQDDDAIALSKLLCEDYAKSPAVLANVATLLVSQAAPSPRLIAAAEKIATPLGGQPGEGQAAAQAAIARIARLKSDSPKESPSIAAPDSTPPDRQP